MNDARIQKVIADTIRSEGLMKTAEEWAVDVLAALRAEGYEIYRPDDCRQMYAYKHNDYRVVEGTYRLVPVGGEG